MRRHLTTLAAAFALAFGGATLIADSADAAPPSKAAKTRKRTKKRVKRNVKRGNKATGNKRSRATGFRGSRGGKRTSATAGDAKGDAPLIRYFVAVKPNKGRPKVTLEAKQSGAVGIFVRRVDKKGQLFFQKQAAVQPGQKFTITLPANSDTPEQCVKARAHYEISVMGGQDHPGTKSGNTQKGGNQMSICLSEGATFFDPGKAYGGKIPVDASAEMTSAWALCARPGGDPWPDPDPGRCR